MRLKILTSAALLLCGAACFAQTGILDPDAEFRRIPSEARELAKATGADFGTVLDSLNRYYTERPVPGSHRKGDNPVLFLIGDSTMRTEVDGNGSNGQWGWGYFIQNWFDTSRITV